MQEEMKMEEETAGFLGSQQPAAAGFPALGRGPRPRRWGAGRGTSDSHEDWDRKSKGNFLEGQSGQRKRTQSEAEDEADGQQT